PSITNNGPVECTGDFVTLSASSTPNAQFEWSGPQNFSSQSAMISFEVEVENMGDYAAIAEMNGCFSSPAYTSVAIININDFDDYDFPNVITPNGDGVND
ncbi:MAG: hypothetical protein ACKO7P_07360, partial [Bacteroidota bacterium]